MNCREIQDRLADEPAAASRDPQIRTHLEACPACQTLLRRLQAVDEALTKLPAVFAPPDVVQRTVHAVSETSRRPRPRLRLAAALATSMLMLVVIVFGSQIRENFAVSESALSGEEVAPDSSVKEVNLPRTEPAAQTAFMDTPDGQARHSYTISWQTPKPDEQETGARPGSRVSKLVVTDGPSSVADRFTQIQGQHGQDDEMVPVPVDEDKAPFYYGRYGDAEHAARQSEQLEATTYPPKVSVLDYKGDELSKRLNQPSEKLRQLGGAVLDKRDRAQPGWDFKANEEGRLRDKAGELSKNKDSQESNLENILLSETVEDRERAEWEQDQRRGESGGDSGLKVGDEIDRLKKEKKKGRVQAVQEAEEKPSISNEGEFIGHKSKESLAKTEGDGHGTLKVKTDPWASVYVDGHEVGEDSAFTLPAGKHRVRIDRQGYWTIDTSVQILPGETRYLNLPLERAIDEVGLDELKFIPARGYFANTYLPGDPQLVWLRSKLERVLLIDGQPLKLQRTVAPYRQPFDAPATSGMTVFMHADTAWVDGPRRVTLQVGLKGSARHARRRASLHAVLVVDLRVIPTEDNRRILWSLADAMAGDLQAGDRFTLVVAGIEKPVQVLAAEFDMSTIRMSLARALQEREASGQIGTLKAALEAACKEIGADEVGQAPLGANLVMLASAAPVGKEVSSILDRVHRWALLGISLTTIGVGTGADMQHLGALAQAGQGRRRMVSGAAKARMVMEAELAASGRVVARAVRLRIRLADGVKLVAVLGSRPLDARSTTRVRQAERAVDRRVSETLGIEADRGEDEDGIQVVIPAYYAGDDHVILVDVVVPGPGKVADVRVRYKDLVNLQNAVTRASLSLPASRRSEDPLVQNVQKNLLAYRVSRNLLQAASELEHGNIDAASQLLARAQTRIERLKLSAPVFADDAELLRDGRMLAEYRQVLDDHVMWQGKREVQMYLVRSLAYAGRVMLPPGEPR